MNIEGRYIAFYSEPEKADFNPKGRRIRCLEEY
jgi:hypothetical protein